MAITHLQHAVPADALWRLEALELGQPVPPAQVVRAEAAAAVAAVVAVADDAERQPRGGAHVGVRERRRRRFARLPLALDDDVTPPLRSVERRGAAGLEGWEAGLVGGRVDIVRRTKRVEVGYQ